MIKYSFHLERKATMKFNYFQTTNKKKATCQFTELEMIAGAERNNDVTLMVILSHAQAIKINEFSEWSLLVCRGNFIFDSIFKSYKSNKLFKSKGQRSTVHKYKNGYLIIDEICDDLKYAK